MEKEKPSYTTYILRTDKNTLYTGYTSNLKKRLLQHGGELPGGAKYMKKFNYFSLVYTQIFDTKSEAMKWEAKIKGMTKIEKEKLCNK